MKTGSRIVIALATAGLTLGALGCRSGDRRLMVSIPPPRDWQEELRQLREQRDDFFRTSAESPLLPEDVPGFRGLDYWEPDPRYYFVGPINRYVEPERFSIVTTAGQTRPCEKLGWIGFTVDGTFMTLQVYRLLDVDPSAGGDGLLLPFNDGTTGKESYPAGRYLDLRIFPGGLVALDFNKAYNPSCAYGDPERFACPSTPAANRLSVRIEAGERGYREPATGG